MMRVDARVIVLADEQYSNFEGELTISGTTFLYRLRFVVPIDDYMETLRGKTTDEFRKAIDIQVRLEETQLELDNEEWRLFYYFLVPSILKIYGTQKQASQQGIVTAGGVITERGTITLKPEAIHLLAQ